jgi:hypothetical protein
MEEGSKHVGIYPEGYRVIAFIVRISQAHDNPNIRAEAEKFLAEFDKKNGIGRILFRPAYRFAMAHIIKDKVHRKGAKRGMRKLRASEKLRIEEFIANESITDDERSEAKRIQASIWEEKITSDDYNKLRGMIIKYHQPKHITKMNGWRKIDDKIYNDMQALLQRPDVSDTDKDRMEKVMFGMEDRRLKLDDYLKITRLLTDNKANKEERAKREKASKTFEHALFMACQACDNLDGMKMPVLSRDRRLNLVVRISRAVNQLSQFQCQLLQEEEDEGRN